MNRVPMPGGVFMEAVALKDVKARLVTDLYIAGKWVRGASSRAASVTNPFDNSEICTVFPASEEQVDEAIEAADRAFRHSSWKRLTGRDRGLLLHRLAEL